MGKHVLKLYVSCHTFKNALCRIFIQATIEPNVSLVNTDINNQKSQKKHMAYLNLDKHQKNPYSKRNKNILLRRNIGHEYYGIFSVLKCDL